MSYPLDETERVLVVPYICFRKRKQTDSSVKSKRACERQRVRPRGSPLETVTGVEPALMDLQSIAFPLG